MSDFYKIKCGGRVSQVCTLRPNFAIVTLKMWAYNPQNRWNWQFFGINLPKRGIPLSDFYKIWLGGGSHRFAPSCQISSLWIKKMWEYSAQNRRNWCFWYKFAHRGIPPGANFYKIWLGDGLPGSHSHAKFYRFGLINVGLGPKTSPKIVIFGINLPKMGISP